MPNASKENLIPLLEKYYEAFIKENDVWTFFLELSEYLELIFENEATEKIVGVLNKQKEQDLKALQDIELCSIEELETSVRKVSGRLSKKNITSKKIEEALHDIKAMEDGRVWTSTPKATYIDRQLKNIVEALVEEKKEDLVKDFRNNVKDARYPLDEYIFSPSLKEYEQLRDEMDFKEKTTIWYAWDHLQWVYLVIKKSDETLQGIKAKNNREETDSFISLVREMEKIQSYKDRIDVREKLEPLWFDREDFVQYARRFHKHTIKALSGYNQKDIASPLAFDSKRSILSFQGKKIEIAKSRKTDAHHLLATLFKDTEKTWEYDEIAEDWGEAYQKEDWQKYYQASYSVNEKVAKKTEVEDFLLPTNKTVVINEKYR